MKGRAAMIYCCESYLPNSGNPYLCGDPFEPSDLIRLLDEAGIAAALTIPAPEAPLPGWPPTDNGTVRQAMETYPSRILGCCHVDPRRGREAVEEFRRTIDSWGFFGLKLSMVVCPATFELAGAAADMRVPVTIHTNGSADLYPRIADLAERYPGLTVVMEHMGYRPHVALAIDLVKRYANLYLGTTVVGAAEPVVVRQAIREVGAERVLFGANAPWAVPCYGVEGIRSLGLNAEDERLVLGENFRRIYRLS
jgi:predicted TIM-barrel fold metal-dependent hydrolase